MTAWAGASVLREGNEHKTHGLRGLQAVAEGAVRMGFRAAGFVARTTGGKKYGNEGHVVLWLRSPSLSDA